MSARDVHQATSTSKQVPAVTHVATSHLQRKCACGQHTGAGGECESCRQKREGTLQRAALNADAMNTVPLIVHEVLRSSGQALDAGTRAFMGPRFGHDFSGVRVHTGEKAAESARAVDALAYTVGNDVVFGAGQFAPQTTVGHKLLAHELTHVVQQAAGPAPNRIELGQPNDRYEQEADARSLQISEAGPAESSQHRNYGTISSRVSQRVLQRSLLGGILGGIGGALGGALVGGLIGGPIGAIVGGVAGLVGGALLADKATTKSRSLTANEIKYATDIFKNSIDYSAITITRDSMLSAGAPRTIGNTIHLKSDWGHFVGDTMELSPPGTRPQSGLETLIHEMGHVWQYQNGGLAYIPDSIWAQIKASAGGGSRNAAYDWRAAHTAGVPWEQWNPEQQAEAIEDYNKLLRMSKDGTASVAELSELSTLVIYMAKVWRRQGAPHFERPEMKNSPI